MQIIFRLNQGFPMAGAFFYTEKILLDHVCEALNFPRVMKKSSYHMLEPWMCTVRILLLACRISSSFLIPDLDDEITLLHVENIFLI